MFGMDFSSFKLLSHTFQKSFPFGVVAKLSVTIYAGYVGYLIKFPGEDGPLKLATPLCSQDICIYCLLQK